MSLDTVVFVILAVLSIIAMYIVRHVLDRRGYNERGEFVDDNLFER